MEEPKFSMDEIESYRLNKSALSIFTTKNRTAPVPISNVLAENDTLAQKCKSNHNFCYGGGRETTQTIHAVVRIAKIKNNSAENTYDNYYIRNSKDNFFNILTLVTVKYIDDTGSEKEATHFVSFTPTSTFDLYEMANKTQFAISCADYNYHKNIKSYRYEFYLVWSIGNEASKNTNDEIYLFKLRLLNDNPNGNATRFIDPTSKIDMDNKFNPYVYSVNKTCGRINAPLTFIFMDTAIGKLLFKNSVITKICEFVKITSAIKKESNDSNIVADISSISNSITGDIKPSIKLGLVGLKKDVYIQTIDTLTLTYAIVNICTTAQFSNNLVENMTTDTGDATIVMNIFTVKWTINDISYDLDYISEGSSDFIRFTSTNIDDSHFDLLKEELTRKQYKYTFISPLRDVDDSTYTIDITSPVSKNEFININNLFKEALTTKSNILLYIILIIIVILLISLTFIAFHRK